MITAESLYVLKGPSYLPHSRPNAAGVQAGCEAANPGVGTANNGVSNSNFGRGACFSGGGCGGGL
jgi:hypothetical protein